MVSLPTRVQAGKPDLLLPAVKSRCAPTWQEHFSRSHWVGAHMSVPGLDIIWVPGDGVTGAIVDSGGQLGNIYIYVYICIYI